MNKTAIFLLIVCICASGAYGQSIRVATYNVNWGNRRGDQAIDAIKAANADILCLQETTPQSEQFLRKHLADVYPEFHAAGHNGTYLAERFVFASKIKLHDLRFHPPDAGLFGFYTATFRLRDQDVSIVNVHLSPVHVKRGTGLPGVMAALSQIEDTHSAEVEAVVEQINRDQPTIIVGDFNSLSTFNAPQRLLQLGFVDSFASVTPDADLHSTWHWPIGPLPIALRIDYIFHTPQFQTSSSEIIRRVGSDHFLLVTELTRGEPTVESDAPIKAPAKAPVDGRLQVAPQAQALATTKKEPETAEARSSDPQRNLKGGENG